MSSLIETVARIAKLIYKEYIVLTVYKLISEQWEQSIYAIMILINLMCKINLGQ